jgi:hypothetical protein
LADIAMPRIARVGARAIRGIIDQIIAGNKAAR